MNREIKFRGKSRKTGEWVYGGYYPWNKEWGYIIKHGDSWDGCIDFEHIEVKAETVGMMIPFDFLSNGYLYEGDILERIGTIDDFSHRGINTFKRNIVVVELIGTKDGFGKKEFGFSINTQRSYSERTHPATYTIIGNIHDNPELLNNEQK